MSQFVESAKKSSGFKLCGRMIRDNESLVVFIDGIGIMIPEVCFDRSSCRVWR